MRTPADSIQSHLTEVDRLVRVANGGQKPNKAYRKKLASLGDDRIKYQEISDAKDTIWTTWSAQTGGVPGSKHASDVAEDRNLLDERFNLFCAMMASDMSLLQTKFAYARALNPDNPYLARTDPIEDGVYIRHRTPWGMRTMNRHMQGDDTLDEAETTSKKGAKRSSRSRSALNLVTLPFAATAAATSAAASSRQNRIDATLDACFFKDVIAGGPSSIGSSLIARSSWDACKTAFTALSSLIDSKLKRRTQHELFRDNGKSGYRSWLWDSVCSSEVTSEQLEAEIQTAKSEWGCGSIGKRGEGIRYVGYLEDLLRLSKELKASSDKSE